MKKMRKGFTLIELLIVISVIGTIAAMMTISSEEAMTTAKAGNIVSNLRNFVTAANEYYFDNMDAMYKAEAKPAIADVRLYMNKGLSGTSNAPETKLDNYFIVTATATDKSAAEVDWFVGYKLPTNGVGTGEVLAIKEKLKGRATNTGLFGSANEESAPNIGTDEALTTYNGEAVVWMRAHEASRRTAGTGGSDPATDPAP